MLISLAQQRYAQFTYHSNAIKSFSGTQLGNIQHVYITSTQCCPLLSSGLMIYICEYYMDPHLIQVFSLGMCIILHIPLSLILGCFCYNHLTPQSVSTTECLCIPLSPHHLTAYTDNATRRLLTHYRKEPSQKKSHSCYACIIIQYFSALLLPSPTQEFCCWSK